LDSARKGFEINRPYSTCGVALTLSQGHEFIDHLEHIFNPATDSGEVFLYRFSQPTQIAPLNDLDHIRRSSQRCSKVVGNPIHETGPLLDQVLNGLTSSVLNGDGHQTGCLLEEVHLLLAKPFWPAGVCPQDADHPILHSQRHELNGLYAGCAQIFPKLKILALGAP
jgi:hypothetical protein